MTTGHPREPRPGRPGRDERGAALVEFAIVLPLLALFLVGILEVGLMTRTKHVVVEAARSGARSAANVGTGRLADYNALAGVVSSIRADTGVSLDSVIIFNATTSATPPAACRQESTAGVCNRYDAAFLRAFADKLGSADGGQTAFSGTCSGAPDGAWCPTSRDAVPAGGLDSIGVEVTVRRSGLTGTFGGRHAISDTSVASLEPVFGGLS